MLVVDNKDLKLNKEYHDLNEWFRGESLTIYSEAPEDITHPEDIKAILWMHNYAYVEGCIALSRAHKNAPNTYIALFAGDNHYYTGHVWIYITKKKMNEIKEVDKLLLKGVTNAKSGFNTYIKPGKPE